jgi:hypothetical protein
VAPYRSDKVTFGFVGAIAAPGRIEFPFAVKPAKTLPWNGSEKRQKAEFCLWLIARTSNRDLRAGVEQMRIALLKEAEALEKERGQTAT